VSVENGLVDVRAGLHQHADHVQVSAVTPKDQPGPTQTHGVLVGPLVEQVLHGVVLPLFGGLHQELVLVLPLFSVWIPGDAALKD
jgi:hypothetical protein